MRIAVFGLGYVGSVTAACLAADGHTVVGVDPNLEKVASVQGGIPPVREPGLAELMSSALQADRLSATSDPQAAVDTSDVAIVCVGTPNGRNGNLDLLHVREVACNIGTALSYRDDRYTIILRSTVLPGSTRNTFIPELEAASSKSRTADFDVVFNPEFLREGTSVQDYYNPPKIVVGTEYGKPNHVLNELYERFDCPRFEAAYEVAELAKYVDNAWHALKVSFANEIGRLSKAEGVDGRDVMDIMVSDLKLNISPKYLRPGFSYGGSCLPKDLSALGAHAQELGLSLPVVEAIERSNDHHRDLAVQLVRNIGDRRVGMLGLTFKANTDDLRNSPFVEMVRELIDSGFEVRVADPNIDMDTLIGANLTYLRDKLPDAEEIILNDPHDVVEFADTVILGKDEPGLIEAAEKLQPGQHLLDLVGMTDRPIQGEYVGIGW